MDTVSGAVRTQLSVPMAADGTCYPGAGPPMTLDSATSLYGVCQTHNGSRPQVTNRAVGRRHGLSRVTVGVRLRAACRARCSSAGKRKIWPCSGTAGHARCPHPAVRCCGMGQARRATALDRSHCCRRVSACLEVRPSPLGSPQVTLLSRGNAAKVVPLPFSGHDPAGVATLPFRSATLQQAKLVLRESMHDELHRPDIANRFSTLHSVSLGTQHLEAGINCSSSVTGPQS